MKIEKRLERSTKANFDPFIEIVDEGREKKLQRVKCLLCGNGRLLSLGNFSRHMKAIHEPPVTCEKCGKEFSGEQMRTHRRKSGCKERHLEHAVEKSVKVEHTEVVDISSKAGASLGPDQTPASGQGGCSTPTRTEADGTEWLFLTLTSAFVEGIVSKLKIQKGKRVKKVMRAFGKQHRIEY